MSLTHDNIHRTIIFQHTPSSNVSSLSPSSKGQLRDQAIGVLAVVVTSIRGDVQRVQKNFMENGLAFQRVNWTLRNAAVMQAIPSWFFLFSL